MSKKAGFLLALVFLLAACSPSQTIVTSGYVNLDQRSPLPTPLNRSTVPLRVAVAAVISPQGTVESYTELLNLVGENLHRPVELVQRRTYMEINDLVKDGDVDMAFVCTSAYIAGHDEFGMELLVAPLVDGQTVYYSLLIVPSDSTAKSMADLRGKIFAFTDPISLSGRMYPTYLVNQLGSTPEEFFSRTFFTYSHDQAIQAVVNKVADGAAVDSLVYAFAVSRDPQLGQLTHVIHRSPAFGIPPVVVNPNIRPQLKVELQSLLLNMHTTSAGLQALKAIGVDRFVLIDDSAYNDVRTLLGDVNQTR